MYGLQSDVSKHHVVIKTTGLARTQALWVCPCHPLNPICVYRAKRSLPVPRAARLALFSHKAYLGRPWLSAQPALGDLGSDRKAGGKEGKQRWPERSQPKRASPCFRGTSRRRAGWEESWERGDGAKNGGGGIICFCSKDKGIELNE